MKISFNLTQPVPLIDVYVKVKQGSELLGFTSTANDTTRDGVLYLGNTVVIDHNALQSIMLVTDKAINLSAEITVMAVASEMVLLEGKVDKLVGTVSEAVVSKLAPVVTPPPLPEPNVWAIVATAADKVEGDTGVTPFTFTVSRSGDVTQPATVQYEVLGGNTPLAGANDFVGGVFPAGTLTFASGVHSQVLTINVQGDTWYELDNTFTVRLSNPSSGTLATATAGGVIRNDDQATTTPPPAPVEPTPVTPPVSTGKKTTAAPVLQNKGLSLIWQDRLGESDAPANLEHFMDPYAGGRYHHCDFSPAICDLRISPATFDSKSCLKSTYTAKKPGILNYRNMYLTKHVKEIGVCVDVYYDKSFAPTNSAGGTIHGKSLFGLSGGHADYGKPGVPSSPRGWSGEVTWPEDQWGMACGLNWKYWKSEPGVVQLGWYPNIIGAYINGEDRIRLDRFSNLYGIPGFATPDGVRVTTGEWHQFVLYGKIDTNRRNGVLEFWVDGVMKQGWSNLDLGGWVGNRGLSAKKIGNGTNGDKSLSTGAGQLCGASGGGWSWSGIFIRDMIGGYTLDEKLIPTTTATYYAHNWRVYGK